MDVTDGSKQLLSAERASMEVWHRHLGHLNSRALSFLAKDNLIAVSNPQRGKTMFEPYFVAKTHKHPHHSHSTNYNVLDLIFLDIWGPSPVE